MEPQLIKYLNKLKSKAIDAHPTESLKKRYSVYKNGTLKTQKSNTSKYSVNSTSNILKSIVDTVATFTLDQQLTKEVVLRSMSFSDFENLQLLNDKAAVLNDCLQDVVDNNYDKEFQRNIVLSMLIYGVGISKVYWNQDSANELGEVKYHQIDPCNFYPDPSATDINNANYIFVKSEQSVFDLVNKYKNNPEILEKIKTLTPGNKDNSYKSNLDAERTDNIISVKNDTTSAQAYMPNNYDDQYKKSTNNITIYECYLKDDTIFIDPEGDDSDELKMQQFMYPNGRVITYTDKCILEDKAIDYPFGFPFDIQKGNYDTDGFFPCSLVEYLTYPQERLDAINKEISGMIGSRINATLIPAGSEIDKESLCRPEPIIEVPHRSIREGEVPINYTNNNLQYLPLLEQRAQLLEQDMYNIARVNKMMISGERPVGVNSGRMVEDLIESPMTAIREMQRELVSLNIRLSDKIITLIQLYYKSQRIIRLSTGDFIEIDPLFMENAAQENLSQIRKSVMNQNNVMEIAVDIKTDLSSGEFETKIIAGSEMPLNRTQLAQLTVKFAQEGFFNPVDIDIKEFVLDKLEYPNYRAVIDKMRQAQEQNQLAVQEEMRDPANMLLAKLQKADIKPDDLLKTINNITDESVKNDATLQLLSLFGYTPPQVFQSPGTDVTTPFQFQENPI